MQQHRPSILHLSSRKSAQVTLETSQAQYEKEQEYWRQKAQKNAETQERLMRSLYPMPEDKQAVYQDQRQFLDQHMQARMLQREAEMKKEQALAGKPSSQTTAHVYVTHDDKPWLHPSMVYSSSSDEKLARRKHEEQVLEENKRLAMQRQALRQSQEQAELEKIRRVLNDQQCFWNMGSNGDRYMPPELRRNSPRDGPHNHGASANPPVWAWSAEAAAKPQTAPLVRPQTASPASKAPYAWEPELQQQRGLGAQTQAISSRPSTAQPRPTASVPWATDADLPSTTDRAGAWQTSRPGTAAAQRSIAPFATTAESDKNLRSSTVYGSGMQAGIAAGGQQAQSSAGQHWRYPAQGLDTQSMGREQGYASQSTTHSLNQVQRQLQGMQVGTGSSSSSFQGGQQLQQSVGSGSQSSKWEPKVQNRQYPWSWGNN